MNTLQAITLAFLIAGIAILLFGWWVKRSTPPDDFFWCFILAFGGAVLMVDGLIALVYGAYRIGTGT